MESRGILDFFLPGLESYGKQVLVMENEVHHTKYIKQLFVFFVNEKARAESWWVTAHKIDLLHSF